MDTTPNPEHEIERLNQTIEEHPVEASLYLERGRIHHRMAHYDLALNDFLTVARLAPDNLEAQEYITLLREIFAFRNMDLYNP